MDRRHLPLQLAIVVAAAAAPAARGDLIWSWGELGAQRVRRGGLFATWGPDQGEVLSALLAVERSVQTEALGGLELRVAEQPNDAAARDLLGRAYLRQQRVSAAIEQFRAAVRIDPGFRSSRMRLADIYAAAGRMEAAAHEMSALIEADPAAKEAYERLAAIRLHQARHREAAELLAKAVELAPKEVRGHLRLARALLRAGQADEAASAAEAACRLAPDDPAPHMLLADCHRARGNLDASVAALNAAAGKGGAYQAYQRLGLLRLHQRQFNESRAAFLKAIEADRRAGAAIAGLVVACQGLGDLAGAANACRRLRKHSESVTRFLLANLWLAKGDRTAVTAVFAAMPGQHDELAAEYAALLDAFAERAKERRELALEVNAGALFQRAGWLSEAIGAFSAARKIAPDSTVVGEMLATACDAAGRWTDSMAVWEELAGEHPDSVAVRRVLARRYLSRGRIAEAREACAAILAEAPEDRIAHRVLATISLREGDYPKATEHAQAAFRAEPADPVALDVVLDALLARDRFAEAAAALAAHVRAASDAERGPLLRALEALARGDLAKARREVELGLERSVLDARLRCLAGTILERQGAIGPAVAHYEAAVLADPRYLPARTRLGRAALRAGRIGLALHSLRTAAEAAPRLLDVQLGLADALSKAGRHADAVAHLRRLPRVEGEGPASREIQARLARELLAAGEVRNALAAAEEVLIERPDHPLARRIAVGIHRRYGDLAAAAKVYERIVVDKGEGDVAPEVDGELGVLRLVQRQFGEAVERLDRASQTPEVRQRGSLFLWHAAARLGLGQAGAARTAAEQAEAAGVGRASPSLPLIIVLGASGAEAKARTHLERLGKAEPDLAEWVGEALPRLTADTELAGAALASLAAAANGWTRQAVALAGAARERAPELPLLLYLEATHCLDARLVGQALTAARELVRVRPKAGLAQFTLGRVLEAQGQREAAADAYAQAAARMPKENAASWATIGQALSSADRVDGAIDAYRTALTIEPDFAVAANNLAWLYAVHRPGRLAEAEQLAEAAVRVAADFAPFRDTLGWIYFLRRKLPDAQKQLEAALRLEPDNAGYTYHLGMVHFALDHPGEARKLLRRALGLDPGLADADTARATLQLLGAESPPEKP